MNQLMSDYRNTVLPAILKETDITNPMAAPKLVKIVVNCGIGAEALKDKKIIEKVATQLAVITGQKPQITRARKAISTFKLRIGDPVGLRVTLRGDRMYDFFMRLVRLALPRVRDFRGVPKKGFDGKGNYTMGISEQTIFPELDYNLIDKIRGFEITFVTSAKDDVHGKLLLEKLGMPFEKGNQ